MANLRIIGIIILVAISTFVFSAFGFILAIRFNLSENEIKLCVLIAIFAAVIGVICAGYIWILAGRV